MRMNEGTNKGTNKNKRKKGVIYCSVILLLVAISASTVTHGGEFYFSPQHSVCSVGERTHVLLMLNTSTAIRGYQTDIYFDPSVVRIESVNCSVSPWGGGMASVTRYEDHVTIAEMGGNVPEGHYVLANISLNCVGEGLSHIDFRNTLLSDPLGNPVNVSMINGTVRVEKVEKVEKIVINEFMADPSAGDDWVELYNPSASDVNLTGWSLNDSTSRIKKLSGSIPAGGYLVVHVGNRLDKNGDEIILLKDGIVIDNVTYGGAPGNAPVPPADRSTGRYPDGKDTDVDSEDFVVFDVPTPGAKNEVMREEPLTPFLVFGYVHSEAASSVGAPLVKVTNLNTSEIFVAETAENYYQILMSSDDVSVGDVLHFEASGENAEFNITVSEDNIENGGLFSVNITIALLPDLSVSAMETPPEIYANMENIINATISNMGYADASAFNVSLCVNGTVIDHVSIDSLSAGGTVNVSFAWTPPSAGDYEICVVSDADDDVEESDEKNNALCRNVTVYVREKGVRVIIGDYSVLPDGEVSAPITLHNIIDYGAGTICVEYDPHVIYVTDVSSSQHSYVGSYNIDNAEGVVCISAWNETGASGDIVFAYVRMKAVGSEGSSSSLILNIKKLVDIHYRDVPTFVEKGSFSIKEGNAPIVGNPTATPNIILNDNGRARVHGTNITRLNVSVSDDSGVSSVTVNLTPILGPGHDEVPMTLIEGDRRSGIWSVVTNATYGVNNTHCLRVNATDVFGNSNTDKCILLTVLRRGDIVRDDRVDIADALYIARYTVGLEPAPDEIVAGVVPADAFDGVDMADALYIARYTVGLEPAP